METRPPLDKYKLVYFTFVLHGIGALLPWNMFITAKSYFVDFKLDKCYTEIETNYSLNFLAYLGFASQIPAVTFNWLNIFIRIGGSFTLRIVCSILVEICIFFITIILAMSDTSKWPGIFFWITMVCVVLLNMANGVFQNTVYGMVAKLPINYTGAVILGTNMSGVFVTVISLTSSATFSSHRTAAIYYFIFAILVLLICFDIYFALPLNKFYRYYEFLNRSEIANKFTETHSPYWTIFKKSFPQMFNVFFVFFVTLSIFPAVYSDIKAVDDDFIVTPSYFVGVTCFLTFSLFALIGSLITSWVVWPKPKYLVWPIILRVVFIPLFLYCNYHPQNIERVLPVYITNDWVYWILGALLAFSSGYLSSLSMMYAPKTVSPKYSVTAGMFAGAMLVTGVFTGVLFSSLGPIVVA